MLRQFITRGCLQGQGILLFVLFHSVSCGCPFPKNELENGRFVFMKRRDVNATSADQHYVLRFKCYTGYQLIGDGFIKCIQNKWTGAVPRCEKNSCPDPGMSKHGCRSGICCLSGAVLRYFCNEDYELVGNSQIRCLVNGSWSSARPLCRPKSDHCELPPPIPHGQVIGDKDGDYFQLYDEAEVVCEPGYEYKGLTKYILCKEKGQWEDVFGECTEKMSCPDPGIPEYGFRTGPCCHSGDILHYSCKEDYELVGNSEIRCSGNGSWLSTRPLCTYSQCGIRMDSQGNGNRDMRGGKNQEPWPWMAALYYFSKISSEWEFRCGGTIINENLILTAAYCMSEGRGNMLHPKDIIVKLGLTDLENETYVQQFEVRKIYIHPGYRRYDSNIAMLQVNGKIQYNSFVRPICLPPADLPSDSPLYKPGENVWATVWSYKRVEHGTDAVSYKISKVLEEHRFRIQPRGTCTEKMGYFPDTTFCADDGKKGPDVRFCIEDRGSPMMQSQLNSKGHLYWTQVGIVSWRCIRGVQVDCTPTRVENWAMDSYHHRRRFL